MPGPATDADRRLGGAPPAHVEVTVIAGPRGPTLSQRIANVRPRVRGLASASPVGFVRLVGLVGLVGLAIVIGAVAGIPSTGGRTGPARGERRQVSSPSPVRVVSAAIPLGCVSFGVALHDPRFGRASFDRRFPCLRQSVAFGGRERPGARRSRALRPLRGVEQNIMIG
jgi:hypothetical protein